MVQYQGLDRTLAALADPTRRAVLERISQGALSISELAAPFGISLTGMKKHVRVLEEAELVRTEKVGRVRQVSIGPRRLDDLEAWMQSYRQLLEERYDRLDELLARQNRELENGNENEGDNK